MNVFRSFNFGKIIKIVLPGFFSLVGIISIFDLLSQLIFNDYLLLKTIKSNSALSIFFAIPLSLSIGLTCNTIFFIFINNIWFKRWFARKYPEIKELTERIFGEIKSKLIEETLFSDETKNMLLENSNSSALILDKVDITKYEFLQESYWNYFEYHVNMIMASIVCFIGWMSWGYFNNVLSNISIVNKYCIIILCTSIFLIFLYVTIKAAKLNYYKFQIKQLSYFSSLIKQ